MVTNVRTRFILCGLMSQGHKLLNLVRLKDYLQYLKLPEQSGPASFWIDYFPPQSLKIFSASGAEFAVESEESE